MNQQSSNSSSDSVQNRIVGCMLIFFMVGIVAMMVYCIYISWITPKSIDYVSPTTIPLDLSPSPTATELGSFFISPSPTMAKNTSPTQVVKKSPASLPEISPTKEAEPSPLPKASPMPKPSPTKFEEKKFQPLPPDGPPDMERAIGDMFAGKTGKAHITINVSEKIWKGTRAYLIDNNARNYRPLKFESAGKNKYKVAVPPGSYTLKLVKSGYLTFTAELPLADQDDAEINDPLEKRPFLEISSIPPGAKIYINGLFAGTTPTVIKSFEDKEYGITLVKPGFERETFKVRFEGGKGIKKNVELQQTW